MKLSRHAIERYVERVKPALTLKHAEQELAALVEMAGPPSEAPPAWFSALEPDTDCFLELADGIVAPVKSGYVTTIVVRGGSTPTKRAEKKAAKRKARAHKHWQNKLREPGARAKGRERGWA